MRKIENRAYVFKFFENFCINLNWQYKIGISYQLMQQWLNAFDGLFGSKTREKNFFCWQNFFVFCLYFEKFRIENIELFENLANCLCDKNVRTVKRCCRTIRSEHEKSKYSNGRGGGFEVTGTQEEK